MRLNSTRQVFCALTRGTRLNSWTRGATGDASVGTVMRIGIGTAATAIGSDIAATAVTHFPIFSPSASSSLPVSSSVPLLASSLTSPSVGHVTPSHHEGSANQKNLAKSLCLANSAPAEQSISVVLPVGEQVFRRTDKNPGSSRHVAAGIESQSLLTENLELAQTRKMRRRPVITAKNPKIKIWSCRGKSFHKNPASDN